MLTPKMMSMGLRRAPGMIQGAARGVMAQEVMQTRPDAVSTHPLGFYMVNYDALGLEMV
jgi:hypothetical protein